MAVLSGFQRILGVVQNFFQIGGSSGPGLNNNAGAIEAKNAGNSAFVTVRGADPVAANDFVTLEYGSANYAPAGGGGILPGTVNANLTVPSNNLFVKKLTVSGTGVVLKLSGTGTVIAGIS